MANREAMDYESHKTIPLPEAASWLKRWRANLALMAFIVVTYFAGCILTTLSLLALRSKTHWAFVADRDLIEFGGVLFGLVPAYFAADFFLSRRLKQRRQEASRVPIRPHPDTPPGL